MNDYEIQIQDAIEMVEAWELEGEAFARAVNDQAHLMAGGRFQDIGDLYDRDDIDQYFSQI